MAKSHSPLVDKLPHGYSLLKGKKVLITAGPTREYWDPVRFISNGSSGQTGLVLAREAKRLGADVTLILGPISGPQPDARTIGKIVPVISALEMEAAVQEHLPGTQVFVGAAAVSDYRPAKPSRHKIKKGHDENIHLVLKRNPDIISKVARRGPTRPPNVIGFALETRDILANAKEKLRRKGLDWIVANTESNIDSPMASATLISRWGEQIPLGRMSKGRLAEKNLARVIITAGAVMSEFQDVVASARQWLKQESAWDSQAYASSNPSSSRQVVSRDPVKLPSRPIDPGLQSAGVTAITSDPSKESSLKLLHDHYKDCVRCPLGPTRLRFVFGVGHPNSGVMFIGEGPGYQEDHKGEPFIGKAGQLLDKMMASIGLSRQTNAYIANIVKCHPMINPADPESRGNDCPPTPEEVATCSPILLRQIAVIQPKVIVTLGSPSTKMMLKTAEGISKIRGKLYPFDVEAFYPTNLDTEAGAEDSAPPRLDAATRAALAVTQVLPTYHPAALLRNPNLKMDAWTDLKLLRDTFLRSA